jgi:hypothetical protein
MKKSQSFTFGTKPHLAHDTIVSFTLKFLFARFIFLFSINIEVFCFGFICLGI